MKNELQKVMRGRIKSVKNERQLYNYKKLSEVTKSVAKKTELPNLVQPRQTLHQILSQIEQGVEVHQVIINYWKHYDQFGDISHKNTMGILEKILMVVGIELNEEQKYFKLLYAYLKADTIQLQKNCETEYENLQSSVDNRLLKKIHLSNTYDNNKNLILSYLSMLLHERFIYKHFPFQLRQPPAPYLQYDNRFLVAVDLDETLVHYDRQTKKLLIRPFAVEFLQELDKKLRVVIWTASLSRYAKWVCKRLGWTGTLLSRQFCTEKLVWMKELWRLGYPLDKVLIIDNDIRGIREDERHRCIIVENFIQEDPNDQCLKGILNSILRYQF